MDAAGRWQILRLHVEDQIPLAALARDTGVGLRTLERWHARYRTEGYTGLGTRRRADAGSHHLPSELVSLIEGLALSKPRPTIITIHRKISAICEEGGWPAPSYGVVRAIIADLDPGMVTLALEGPTSYRDKYELALRRQAEHPNAMWQADHTMLDILVVGTDGKPARPWLTTIIDDHSRAICGYTVFLGAPSAMNTALALRQAIWHKAVLSWPMCGLPDVLYVDHGSDFISNQLTGTAVDLHIRLIHSAVARPQGRGKVERIFGTVNTELLAGLPGYIAEGHPWPTPKLSLAELDAALEEFVITYNDRTHSELGTSPRAAWIADGWLPRMPESLEDLDGLLLTVAQTRVVRRDGIHFQGLPARICWVGLGDRHRLGLAFNEMVRTGAVKAPIVIGRDHLDSGSVASPNRETEAMRDGSDAVSDWPLLNALLNCASGATWVSLHHGGGVGMGFSQHAGVVIVCDGTTEADARIGRVLWNDPATGVMRHADAGYDQAIACAKQHGLNLPMIG